MHIYTILKMPNTKSAIRRVRRVKKQTQVNRIRKSKYKNALNKWKNLLNQRKRESQKIFFKFQSIPTIRLLIRNYSLNTAGRKISRISKISSK